MTRPASSGRMRSASFSSESIGRRLEATADRMTSDSSFVKFDSPYGEVRSSLEMDAEGGRERELIRRYSVHDRFVDMITKEIMMRATLIFCRYLLESARLR